MEYLSHINDISINDFVVSTAGMLNIIQNDISKSKVEHAMSYVSMMANLFKALFTRETNSYYNDEENEFRVIYKVPTILSNSGEIIPQKRREFTVVFVSV